MASTTSQGLKVLSGWRLGRFDQGLGTQLPEAYKKFWREWKKMKPAAVHYIPPEGKWKRNELTGEVIPVQEVPIPVIYPPEHNDGIWGGEGVVKGFQKQHPLKQRVPHFWVPVLKRSVVRSEILNEYLSVTVTDRTMELIHDNHGFDHYLLKTLACDLKSTLALKLKRKLLQSLQTGCPELADNPEKQSAVLKEYHSYLNQYTKEEIEWYGLSFNEAMNKLIQEQEAKEREATVPHKTLFRSQLIEQLKQAKLNDPTNPQIELDTSNNTSSNASWLSKINPFAKKPET